MVLYTRVARRLLVAAAVIGSGALIAACGGSSSNNGSAGSSQSAGTASSHKAPSLMRAADLSSDAAGYKIDMTMHETVAGQTFDMTANGSFTPKAHLASMTMNMALPSSAGGEQQFQAVLSGDTIYMKFPPSLASQIPGGKPWISIDLAQLGQAAKLPGLSSLLSSTQTLNDPGQYLDFLRAAAVGSVTDVGQETIDGVQTTHYQAEIQFSKLADAMPSADRAGAQQMVTALEKKATVGDMPVDVWIDGADLVRRIKMNMNETVQGGSVTTAMGRSVSTEMTEDFSDYGAQPAPAVPSSDETTNLLSPMKTGG
jgi:hypothetical protein